MTLAIDTSIAHRFILGKQGLWPGRRWQGIEGAEQAMHAIDFLQLDPLQIIARSHDIQLHSRVLNYKPAMWEEVTYQQRKFFDWGGWLAVRPMFELPYWRTVMQRERDGNVDCDPRVRKNGSKYAAAIAEMRTLLQAQTTVSNRDFDAEKRKRTKNYRGRKDSSLALYYLWRTGEVMIHDRDNFERVYALTKHVAPAHLIREHSDDEVDCFLIKKEISFGGLSRLKRTSDAFQRGVPFSKKQPLVETLLADDEIIEVKIEGQRATHYAFSSDAHLLHELITGRIPQAWQPLDTTTTEEAVILAPLDPVSARGRAKTLFGFDYVWEVYKPKEKRKFGYYTMPILWNEHLVARIDSKFDRETNTFVILGFWLENEQLGQDEAFAESVANGMLNFVTFLGARDFDAQAIKEPFLNMCLESHRTKLAADAKRG